MSSQHVRTFGESPFGLSAQEVISDYGVDPAFHAIPPDICRVIDHRPVVYWYPSTISRWIRENDGTFRDG